MSPHHLVIFGPMGSGKSTVLPLLTSRLHNAVAFREPTKELQQNRFLEDIYTKHAGGAYRLQLAVLFYRTIIRLSSTTARNSAASYIVYDGNELTDKMQYIDFNESDSVDHLSSRQREQYDALAASITAVIPPPDQTLYIHLSAPPPELQRRVHWRGRPEEANLPLTMFEQRYLASQRTRAALQKEHHVIFVDTNEKTPDQIAREIQELVTDYLEVDRDISDNV